MASQLAAALMERLSVTNLSLRNNLPTFRLNTPVVIRAKPTGVFSRNIDKLHVFSELKLVTGNLSLYLGRFSSLSAHALASQFETPCNNQQTHDMFQYSFVLWFVL